MSHSNLEIEFCDWVNFITGSNNAPVRVEMNFKGEHAFEPEIYDYSTPLFLRFSRIIHQDSLLKAFDLYFFYKATTLLQQDDDLLQSIDTNLKAASSLIYKLQVKMPQDATSSPVRDTRGKVEERHKSVEDHWCDKALVYVCLIRFLFS
ncbi:unnamed protein product [Cochlearia groenlandica]